MEASFVNIAQYYYEYHNEPEDSGQINLDDTNASELTLTLVVSELEVIEARDMNLDEDLGHSETKIDLPKTEELLKLLQKTKNISWQNSFKTKLKEFRQLTDNWNGYGSSAPNRIAIGSCETILNILHEKNFQPSTIYASAQDGVTITFAVDQRRGILECYNDGDIISFVYQGDNPAEIREIGNSVSDLREEITRIEEFVHGR
jgi:hypothetical protein